MLLATRQLVRQAPAQCAQTQVGERRVHALAALGGGHLAQLQPVGDVVEHGLVRPQGIRLEDQTKVACLGRHLLACHAVEHRPARDPDRTTMRRLQPGHGAQQPGLATARRAQQRHHLALLQVERYALQDGVGTIAQVQALDA